MGSQESSTIFNLCGLCASARNFFGAFARNALLCGLCAFARNALFLTFLLATTAQAGTMIKVAVVMPEGSAWTNTLEQMTAAVTQETKGDVKFRVYAGGILGSEADVIRQMRINQVQAAGFSGVGLGMIYPQVRILEAPLLFDNYAELDFVKKHLLADFAKGFRKHGYELLGFAEAGFVYLFTRSDPSGADALNHVRMWAWKGDPVAETFLQNFSIPVVPLNLADVNTGLETGMIDAFYAPPLAAVAFQWYAKIRYVLDFPMVNSTGALVMTKASFDRLAPKDQQILKDLAAKYCRKLIELTRKDNAQAMKVILKAGIHSVKPTADQVAIFRANAKKTYQKSIPGLYPRQLFEKVQALLEQYRKTH